MSEKEVIILYVVQRIERLLAVGVYLILMALNHRGGYMEDRKGARSKNDPYELWARYVYHQREINIDDELELVYKEES